MYMKPLLTWHWGAHRMLDLNMSQTILIVEDNDDDFEATERALFRKKNLSNPIVRCRDGQDALDYLNRDGQYASRDEHGPPSLILLDLNMPGLDGRQVLKRIKQDDALCKIPVVVMTTSTAQEDIDASYRAGANTYVHKPIYWNDFVEAILRLHDYWFQIAVLPK